VKEFERAKGFTQHSFLAKLKKAKVRAEVVKFRKARMSSKQEVNVETVSATIVNPCMEEFERRLNALALPPSLAQKVSMWNAFVMEARALCAKLIVTLENISFNVSPFVSTCLAWVVLCERVPETSTIIPGFMKSKDPTGSPASYIPQLFIRTRQPEDLLPLLRQVWGEDHPFAQPELFTDLQTMPLTHLSDCVLLNQIVHVGRVVGSGALQQRRSMPYAELASRVMVSADDSGAAIAEYVNHRRELELDFKNFQFVSSHPLRFLKWVVTKEIRDTVFPQVINMLRSDPTKVEYTRISDEEAERVNRIQEQNVAEFAGAGAGAAAGTPSPSP
jgi:hypothetical protein